MKTTQDIISNLIYAKEHLVCENFVSGERAIMEAVDLKCEEFYARENIKQSALVFLLSGEMLISTALTIRKKVCAGEMFLVPAGDNFYGRAVTDLSLIYCLFDWDMALCNKFSIKQLKNYVSASESNGTNETALLPIHALLLQELEAARAILRSGLSCIHYQRLKRETLFIGLRGFYDRKTLATLFAPILGTDNDFKNKVMQIYPQIETAQELMDRLHMSPSAFKRKFRESFGAPAHQWLIQKKKEKLFRDIVMTKIPIAELADKYKLTVNYMATFCHTHFGKSPTQLRAEWDKSPR